MPKMLERCIARTSRFNSLSTRPTRASAQMSASLSTPVLGPMEVALNAVGLGSLVSTPVSPPATDAAMAGTLGQDEGDGQTKAKTSTDVNLSASEEKAQGRIQSRKSSLSSQVSTRHSTGRGKQGSNVTRTGPVQGSDGGFGPDLLARHFFTISFVIVALLSFFAGYATRSYMA